MLENCPEYCYNNLQADIKNNDVTLERFSFICKDLTCRAEGVPFHYPLGIYRLDMLSGGKYLGSSLNNIQADENNNVKDAVNINDTVSGDYILQEIAKYSGYSEAEIKEKLQEHYIVPQNEVPSQLFYSYKKTKKNLSMFIAQVTNVISGVGGDLDKNTGKDAIIDNDTADTSYKGKYSDIAKARTIMLKQANSFIHKYYTSPTLSTEKTLHQTTINPPIAIVNSAFSDFMNIKNIFHPNRSAQDVLNELNNIQFKFDNSSSDFENFYAAFKKDQSHSEWEKIIVKYNDTTIISNQFNNKTLGYKNIDKFIKDKNGLTSKKGFDILRESLNDRMLSEVSGHSEKIVGINHDAYQQLITHMKSFVKTQFKENPKHNLITTFAGYNQILLEAYQKAISIQIIAFNLNATAIYLNTKYTKLKDNFNLGEEIDSKLGYKEQMDRLINIYSDRIKHISTLTDESLASSKEDNAKRGLPSFNKETLKKLDDVPMYLNVPAYLIYYTEDESSGAINAIAYSQSDKQKYDLYTNTKGKDTSIRVTMQAKLTGKTYKYKDFKMRCDEYSMETLLRKVETKRLLGSSFPKKHGQLAGLELDGFYSKNNTVMWSWADELTSAAADKWTYDTRLYKKAEDVYNYKKKACGYAFITDKDAYNKSIEDYYKPLILK